MTVTPRKLLSVNNYHYRRGGAESVYFDHASLFRGLGWDTAFFSMQHADNVPSEQDAFFVDEIEFGRDYGLVRKLSMAGKIIYSVEARTKLSRLLDAFKPDIAHIHSVYHHISPSILPLLKERNVPVVLTAHDLKLLCPAYTMLSNGRICEKCRGGKTWNVTRNRCIKNSASLSLLIGIESFVHRVLDIYGKHVDKVVAPSRFYRDKFVEWGWPADKLCYIPNYVDAETFEPDYRPGSYFLYFGRLVPDKGVQTLIRAAGLAGARVKVAGTGPGDEAFRALAAECGANVEFVGFQSGDDLHKLIRGARAVVLPSEWYENAPISVLEAYAFGKPVIGADIGGIPEMIVTDKTSNSTGWLFESSNPEQLAVRLSACLALADSELEAMGRAARKLVESRYTSANYLNAMRALYAELGVVDA